MVTIDPVRSSLNLKGPWRRATLRSRGVIPSSEAIVRDAPIAVVSHQIRRGVTFVSLRDLLADDPLSRGYLKLRRETGYKRFQKYIPGDADHWASALSRFAGSTPLAYWDDSTVECALSMLEENIVRTCNALRERSNLVDLGLANLLVATGADQRQDALPMGDGRTSVELSTVFHPEYLRKCEHVLGNLLSIYWSIKKRGGVTGHYVLKNAVAQFEASPEAVLVRGYVDEIRNAIAHGEVFYTARGARYGGHPSSPVLLPDEFLSNLDWIWRSSLALGLGVLLFLARNSEALTRNRVPISPSACGILASGIVERPGFRVVGVFASEVPKIGKQLNVVAKNSFKARPMVILDALRLSSRLLNTGAAGFTRFLMEFHHPWGTPSLVPVSPSKLQHLIDEDAPIERLMEALCDTPMVWENETMLVTRSKAYPLILRSQLRLARLSVKKGLQSGRHLRVRVKCLRNASVRPTARIEVVAVLEDPHADVTREELDGIVVSLCRKYSRMLVRDNPGRFATWQSTPRFPSYVWVRLYRCEGTRRWLGRDSIKEGNLLAAGEQIRGRGNKPVLVRNAEKTLSGVRLRYSYDPRDDMSLEDLVRGAIARAS